MSFTPGPWSYEYDEDFERYNVYGPPGSRPVIDNPDGELIICDIEIRDTAEADARLMAAAPDLLAGVQALFAWIDDRSPDKKAAGWYAAENALKAAIAKATGEAPR